MSYLNWKPKEWREFYKRAEYNENDFLYTGEAVTFKNRNSMIQQLIVNTWIRRIFSNDINITKKINENTTLNYSKGTKLKVDLSDDDEVVYFDLVHIFEKMLAYGEVLTYINQDTKEILLYLDYKKKYENGRLVKVSYKIKTKEGEKDVVHKFDDFGIGSVYENDVLVYSTGSNFLACFVTKNIFDSENWGVPIYGYAKNNIDEFNDSYNEKHVDRNLSRKLLLLPKQMEMSHRDKLNKNNISSPVVNKNSRQFRSWNTTDESAKPQYFSGGFNPQAYLDDMNSELKLIGLHSGLGRKFLSFEVGTGLKTAEEVRSDNQEFLMTEKNLLDRLEALINDLALRFYGSEKLEVEFIKTTLETNDTKNKRLLNEYMAGLIDATTYHLGVGRDYEEIKNINIPKIPEIILEDER